MKNSFIWGIALVLGGILFLLNNIGVFDLSFRGWWTLFIIVPSLIGLFHKGGIVSSLLGIFLGVLLFMGANEIISYNLVWQIFIPIVIISIGLTLLFGPRGKLRRGKDAGDLLAIFGGNEVKVVDEFNGSSMIAVFGGVELDLSEAKITKDIVIDSVAVFGGNEIILPKNVKVKESGMSIFGASESTIKEKSNKKTPTVTISYVNVFGGLDITNK